jgi:hypothetical protein
MERSEITGLREARGGFLRYIYYALNGSRRLRLRAQAVRLREETTGFGMATIRVLQ